MTLESRRENWAKKACEERSEEFWTASREWKQQWEAWRSSVGLRRECSYQSGTKSMGCCPSWKNSALIRSGWRASPEETTTRKPEEKRLKVSKEEEWVEVPTRKYLWKQKTKPKAKKLERPRTCSPKSSAHRAHRGSELRGHSKGP